MENKRTWAVFANGRVMQLDRGRAIGTSAFPPERGEWFVMRSVTRPQPASGQGLEPVGPYGLRLERDVQGRITSREERTERSAESWAYEYDQAGRLARVLRNNGLAESYQYDPQGRRSHEINAFRGNLNRRFQYDRDNRLLMAGNAAYEHDGHGFRSARVADGRVSRYQYAPDGRLLSACLPHGRVLEYGHDDQGQRTVKRVDGLVVEQCSWLDRARPDWAVVHGVALEFHYGEGRVPQAMIRNGLAYSLHCDQVGSLRVVADMAGNPVKEVVYDSFGNVLEDTNPGFLMPIGFAGGLHDPDTGLVRFGFRDYDPDTGRFTALDPIGYAGGDPDLYGYCLDDPVNLVDNQGLWAEDLFDEVKKSTIWGFPPERRGEVLSDYMEDELEEWGGGILAIPGWNTPFEEYNKWKFKKKE